MTEAAYRFMPARELMSLIAGNWASFDSDRERDEPRASDGLLAVEVPWLRFEPDRESARTEATCRGGVVELDLSPLTEGEDYQRDEGGILVLADVLVAQPVGIELRP